MKKKSRILFFIISVLFAIVGFQNCNKVQLTDLTGSNLSTFGAPANTPVVIAACANGIRQNLSKSYLFPKPALTCEWEKSGNLAPRNDYFQARIEQNEALSLPIGSIICDVKFNFEKQQFLYDDHFLLAFNGAVIASSYNFEKVLARKFDILRYDWANIAGMYWDHDAEGTFCVLGGSCAWPDTDVAGTINMNYDAIVFQRIMAEDLTRSEHALKFVSIGDNDDKDCEHSDVSFSLDVEYVTKPN